MIAEGVPSEGGPSESESQSFQGTRGYARSVGLVCFSIPCHSSLQLIRLIIANVPPHISYQRGKDFGGSFEDGLITFGRPPDMVVANVGMNVNDWYEDKIQVGKLPGLSLSDLFSVSHN